MSNIPESEKEELLKKARRGKAFAGAFSNLESEELMNEGMAIVDQLQANIRSQCGGNLSPELEDWCVKEAGRRIPGFLPALKKWADDFQVGFRTGLDDPTLK